MQDDPWRQLALSYAPKQAHKGIEALFALDAALGQVLRTTKEPMVGQMRLAWWREALSALDAAPPPGEPVLQALAAHAVSGGVTGESLARLVDGWEALLGDLGEAALEEHADRRGRVLFELAGVLTGAAGTHLADAGQGWALADLALHLSDAALAAIARERGRRYLDAALGRRWDRAGRALGALAMIARRGLDGMPPASFVLRLARFRLTGR